MTTPNDLDLSTTTVADITIAMTTTTQRPPPNPGPPMTLHDYLMQTYWQYSRAHNLGLYGYPMIIILGTIGNLLTLLIMLKPSMRMTSTCFYMAVLAIFDTLALYFNCFTKWLALFEGLDALKVSSASCKTINFLSYTCFDIAVWILVAMTIERFIAVHFPFKAPKYATIKNGKIVIVILIVVFTGINLHFFWTVSLNERGHCAYLEEHTHFHDKVWPWIDATLYSFTPFALLFIFNILIICDNRRQLKRRSTLHVRRKEGKYNSGFHARLSAMLVTVSIVFLLLSAPTVILISIRDEYFDFTKGVPDFQNLAVYALWQRSTSFCLYLNHSINFLLYCVSGQRFRRELINLLQCKWNVRQIRTSSYLDTTRTQRLSETSTNTTSPPPYKREMANYM